MSDYMANWTAENTGFVYAAASIRYIVDPPPDPQGQIVTGWVKETGDAPDPWQATIDDGGITLNLAGMWMLSIDMDIASYPAPAVPLSPARMFPVLKIGERFLNPRTLVIPAGMQSLELFYENATFDVRAKKGDTVTLGFHYTAAEGDPLPKAMLHLSGVWQCHEDIKRIPLDSIDAP